MTAISWLLEFTLNFGILCNLMLFNIFCFRITGGLIGNKPQAPHMRALHDQDDDDDDDDDL